MNGQLKKLFVPQRIPLAKKNIALNVHPEKDNKVDDDRRAKGEKGEVDKIEPDPGTGNVELFAEVTANAKSLQYHKASKFFQFFHKGNLQSDY